MPRTTEEILKDAEEVRKHYLACNKTDHVVCNGSIPLCRLVAELSAKLREREDSDTVADLNLEDFVAAIKPTPPKKD